MADKAAKTEAVPESGAMPLFYSRPEALNPARHGSLGLTTRGDLSFARAVHAIPVVASEMPAAMRSYPIVFIGPAKAPVIITGVRQGENLFVDKDGRWAAPHYVPAYVRRYPFILAEDPTTAGRLTLCVDRASERVVDKVLSSLGDDKIAPFFNGAEPTEATRQALAFCNQFQIDFRATREMVERIDAHRLFAPRQSTVTLEGGETLNLTDFQVIDEDAFNKLSDEAFLDLRKSGALTLLYCHLASTNSWTSLVHQASLRKAGQGRSPS
ncbi:MULTISPECIES: SapC family protein [Mesorhizobium]|uniref:SapC family protein n=1 Tax=Rhizobium loti TaxID=381 RepID=A0A6M7TUI0_RHILI|nr:MULTISPECIES: SapC family protein [Mesorhizobium]KRB21454.1 SapC family protein [Mesorhizobium sp. Root172]OBQ66295.1 SapC family protein [Mesorhizobium loti]QKC68555.1 SapC family protein [Mesorhizobium loti]